MRLLRWLPGRLLSATIVLVGASILIFLAVRSLPGDLALLLTGPFASQEARDEVTARFALDRPLHEQFLTWLGAALRGDFGTSHASGLPVVEEFAARLPTTGLLAGMALVLTILIGIPLGLYAGTSATTGRGSVLGRIISTIGISIPEFVLGAIIVFLFSRFALGITVGRFTSPAEDFGGGMLSLLLPAIVLAIFPIAAIARTTRDAVLSVLVEPHVLAAVARGERKWFIIRHHVLRNALIPVFTLAATIAAYLLGGAVIVENVFNVPGFGSYFVAALGRRDYAVLQAGVLLVTAFFVAVSFLIDVVTGVIDPRVSALNKGRGA
jgi:peptide/nickel transport system permease protein